jgi:T-complex protein 1 subunit eta
MSIFFSDTAGYLDDFQKYLSINLEISNQVLKLVKTTLGPSSMDKFLFTSDKNNLISNDGATILNSIGINHPIAKIIIEIAKSQDYEVGDGTTTVCLLSFEFINAAKKLNDEGIHIKKISKIFKKGVMLVNKFSSEICENKKFQTTEELKKFLISCCATSLNSKFIAGKRHIFSEIIADIGISLGSNFDQNIISVKSIVGGSASDSFLFQGILIKKPFSYAGSEKQYKKIRYPFILLLDIELELKSEKMDSETKIKKISKYKELIDAEWSLIYEKLDLIAKSGAKAVFSKQPIGDLATQYFAERGILCGGRISNDDMTRLTKGTNGAVVSTLLNLKENSIGRCSLIEERQIGNDRYVLISGLVSEINTIVIRGSNLKILEEIKRCLNDGIMIVKKVIKDQRIVGGAGSIEMKLVAKIKKYAESLNRVEQVVLNKFASCLEIIPRTLCENAGYDPTLILSKLSTAHRNKNCWDGVDIENGDTFDALDNYIWEPISVKENAIAAAVEASCIITSIDNVLFN